MRHAYPAFIVHLYRTIRRSVSQTNNETRRSLTADVKTAIGTFSLLKQETQLSQKNRATLILFLEMPLRNVADKEISIAASRGLPELTQN